jgi:hypothetical protein
MVKSGVNPHNRNLLRFEWAEFQLYSLIFVTGQNKIIYNTSYSYINAISGELKWEEGIVFSRNKMDIIDGIGKFELNCNGSSTVSPNKIKLIMSWYSFIYV